MSKRKPLMTGRDFDALPDAEKERIWQEIDRMTPAELAAQSRPLTKQERALWANARRKLDKPKIRKVSVEIEDQLVEGADRIARRDGVSRSQIFARGIELLMRAT